MPPPMEAARVINHAPAARFRALAASPVLAAPSSLPILPIGRDADLCPSR